MKDKEFELGLICGAVITTIGYFAFQWIKNKAIENSNSQVAGINRNVSFGVRG